ncbi:type II toxin-antitoxin system PemK/MazF family toxin [Nitrosococcus oceani]|nr:type II toxin-antitoxin system PemK/MazF family toxin [Nitrosococcus oceani]
MTRGEVYWVNLDPTQGSEIRKRRPCVLVGASLSPTTVELYPRFFCCNP